MENNYFIKVRINKGTEYIIVPRKYFEASLHEKLGIMVNRNTLKTVLGFLLDEKIKHIRVIKSKKKLKNFLREVINDVFEKESPHYGGKDVNKRLNEILRRLEEKLGGPRKGVPENAWFIVIDVNGITRTTDISLGEYLLTSVKEMLEKTGQYPDYESLVKIMEELGGNVRSLALTDLITVCFLVKKLLNIG